MRIARRPAARSSAPAAPIAVAVAVLLGLGLSACSSGASTGSRSGTLDVVAAENVWGSIAQQLGGQHVEVTSLITAPDADPHDYEPDAADGRAVATADVVLVNGAGYDTWASDLAAANPSEDRALLDVAELADVPDGANPHLWYAPAVVDRVIDRIVATYKDLDPSNAADYDASAEAFRKAGLARYRAAIEGIREEHAGTRIGASESVVVPLAEALELDVRTPEGLLTAVSEGVEPKARDKRTADAQIESRAIEVFVQNPQNATPDVRAQVEAANDAGIPVVAFTETLAPADATFQEWQTAQLEALRHALDHADTER